MATCPRGSITYNATFCACPPGRLLNRTSNTCSLFTASSAIYTETGIAYSVSFPETIFSFDSIKKFTQSQAVFLEATLVMLLSWLLFCFFLRCRKLGDGRNFWFNIRWWISRLDVCFATRHWLDDQQVVVKRKTELGGTFSMASWILFIGLFAALLYQIISKRTIEVHNVRATNAPDLAYFVNDMEFNVTTISSMSCSNLHGLGNLVTGNPGFIDHRVVSLTDLVNYTCQNTSTGPTLTFKCNNCRFNKDFMYISWQFIDLPNVPASAVGFQFNLTIRNHVDKRHTSFVSGTLKNGSAFDDRPVTFRGRDPNVLKFNLFPQIYHNLHDLRLIQPLFHEFVPGSFSRDATHLQASLQTSTDGLVNTTLYVNYLSAYLVEIEQQNIMGPVSFLADLGGLYCICIGIFFYFLVQCEYRIKKLRNEDSTMRNIRNRLKAQKRWDKLRKYVMYTWGCSKWADDLESSKHGSSCSCFVAPSVRGNGSLSSRKRASQRRTDSIHLNRRVSIPSEKSVKGEVFGSTNDVTQHSVGLCEGDTSQSQPHSITDDNAIPLPPPIEFKGGSELEISDIQKNLQNLYNYNVILREKLLTTQSLLHSLTSKSSTSLSGSQT
ncbi:uncharacterized protein LOC110665557 isoform X2 [Hevea brasiliensis]|uniref:uncharacterized protein LOC110665557 isoform X2 n=1 Tax=Hevea brasiliensis TaxID=3981 RepID=UPI0025E72619|nr:uncharacterized protein LOC110665557 isoform X2 [Hevea brasiliensis]